MKTGRDTLLKSKMNGAKAARTKITSSFFLKNPFKGTRSGLRTNQMGGWA